MRLILLSLLLLFTVGGRAGETLPPVKLLSPHNNLLYDNTLTTIVIEASPEKIDSIVITLDTNNSYLIPVNKGRDTYCQIIHIKPGENIITLNTYYKKVKVEESELKIFFRPELFEGIDDEPDTYEEHYFHIDKNEKKCVACHDMTSNIPTGDKVFEDVTQTTCYACHKSLVQSKNSHAPAVNWRCVDCHNGKAGEYDTTTKKLSKYKVPDPVNRSCEGCHEPAKMWDHNSYGHGPVNDGRCERCHDPHGSDHEFFLRKPIWDLCTTCHAEKATEAHVLTSFIFGRNDGAHPTQGKSDPSRPGREFTCSSCHNPHGSSGKYMLRMKGAQPFNVCQRCHKK